MPRIYLDYNASTPLAPEVAESMRPFLSGHFGNPSSAHWAGRPAREAVEAARGEVAALLGAQPGEIIFTGGGSEANNQAIKGIFFRASERYPFTRMRRSPQGRYRRLCANFVSTCSAWRDISCMRPRGSVRCTFGRDSVSNRWFTVPGMSEAAARALRVCCSMSL